MDIVNGVDLDGYHIIYHTIVKRPCAYVQNQTIKLCFHYCKGQYSAQLTSGETTHEMGVMLHAIEDRNHLALT